MPTHTEASKGVAGFMLDAAYRRGLLCAAEMAEEFQRLLTEQGELFSAEQIEALATRLRAEAEE